MEDRPNELCDRWRHTPTVTERLFGIWPVRAGRNHAKPGYRVGPRVIPFYSVHLVLDGSAYVRTPQMPSEAELTPGDGFILFPHIVHEYWAQPDDPPSMTWLGFDGPAAPTFVQTLEIKPARPLLHGLLINRFRPHLPQLEPAFSATATRENSLRPTDYLVRFLGDILDCVAQASGAPSRASWLGRGQEVMDTHYGDGITVSEVADRIGIDRSHFSKEFTREFGLSPTTYLLQARMERAQQLLYETNLSITEVALSVGYADVYSFSHAYRRSFGASPARRRRTK